MTVEICVPLQIIQKIAKIPTGPGLGCVAGRLFQLLVDELPLKKKDIQSANISEIRKDVKHAKISD